LNRIALVSFAVASLVGLPTVASANPLPPGWTELTCVVLDSRPMLIDVATGREVTSSATGVYTVGLYSARILNGALVDASTGTLLPTVSGAVVDQAGVPIVMLSSWSRIACPPGVQLGPVGLQGVAGATGAPGAPGAPGAVSVGPQGPQGLPGATPAVRIAAILPKVVKPKPKATPRKKKARKVKGVRQIAVVG
jgi:hypothetical protein